jgi:hypothetical protein
MKQQNDVEIMRGPLCPVLLKLTRRDGTDRWVLACQLSKGHDGDHHTFPMRWAGDDR